MVAHDVFISYSSSDKAVADIACQALEMVGVRCWIAPRDIRASVPYAEAIIEAIDSSRLVVLIFSAKANTSPHVMREVDRVVAKEIPILPFRVENVAPTKSMEFYIGPTHWLDAFEPPFEKHLVQLARTVMEQLGERPASPDLAKALQAVDGALQALAYLGDALDLESVGQVIGTAIHFGAPIYNAGSPDGCARIYHHTGRGILHALDQAIADFPAKGFPDRLLRAGRKIREAVSSQPAVTSQNADALAWAMRHAFDYTMLLAVVDQGIQRVDQLLAETKASGHSLSFDQLCEVLRVAIAHGNVLYKENELHGCAELHHHTARAILERLAPPPTSNGAGHDDRISCVQQALKPIVEATEPVTDENAEAVAWQLYEAFLGILKGESS